MLRITKPARFFGKLIALIIFSVAFLPLAELKSSAPFAVYLALLIALHVFFFSVLFFDLRRRNYKSKWSFMTRLVAVLVLSSALAALGRSPVRAEIGWFLVLSFVLHVSMLVALYVEFVPKRLPSTTNKISQTYPQNSSERT